ncbi:NAD-dependent succinate-semialdehyde dehydrogenase [Phenylobacterium sp.]|uniref:NAD-dependent succinate-semialdehyde dehydrogenase n=1 Tax=Phenylobacterium sp. TaxID=1871053 RepID=UPI002734D469|nr:NAD-dependent succinate-semialdehyde dehydrogenase [Phenylobacterium sp.]
MIGGSWRDASDRGTFPVENPATGEVLSWVADATPQDAIEALDAASGVQASWALKDPRDRAEILRRGYERLVTQTDRFAQVISMEMGKSVHEARGEVAYAAEFLRWFSEEAVRVHGRYQRAPAGPLRHLISKKPVGPCLLITPWNFPLAMITRKVGPAVAAGCAMVLKPAELTPLTAALFVSLMEEAGLPPGVLNLVSTTRAQDVVGALLADRRLRKVSFTGSTRVGRTILAGAAANVLRTSMELGGNAPFIVFEDADLDAAVEGAVQAKLRNMGQACTAANRFLVHRAVAASFVDRLRDRFAALSAAGGASDGEIMGPLISATARTNVHRMVEDAVDRGAALVLGGGIPAGPGHFYPPTILLDVRPGSRVLSEEIFGPVAPIQQFSDDREAIDLAMDSELGLAAYAYTRDLDRTLRLQDELQTGMLGINTGLISDPAAPFGGVKQSGLGREGGAEGIEEYLTTQYVGVRQAAPSPSDPP